MKKAIIIPEEFKKYRFLIIAFLIGILLLIIPTGSKKETADTDEQRLACVLERTRGVGNAEVLISDNGAVIVCDGAWDSETKFAIIKATEAFTGFASDKIQVLKSDLED